MPTAALAAHRLRTVAPTPWLLAALLAWVALCYAPALPGPYQFDDRVGVAADPAAASLTAWWQAPGHHVRPLTKASFAASHAAGEWLGHVPAGHRTVNLAIHLAAVVMLWHLALQMAATCWPQLHARAAAAGATIACAVFALHPLTTEAVSYISGRSMALGTLLACACLMAWIRARTRGSRGWQAAALVLGGAAALARETVVFSLPLLVLTWELLRADRAGGRGALQSASRALLPFIALCVLALSWMLWHDRYAGLLRMSLWIAQVRSGEASLLAALGHFGALAALLRAPSIDPDVGAALSGSTRALATLAITVVLWWSWRRRLRQPQWLLAALWVVAWLLPLYAWPVRHDAVSERHFYPAWWGVAWLIGMMLGAALHDASTPRPPQRIVALRGALIGAFVVLSALTVERNHDYRSEAALWESAWRSAPNKLRVLNNLGAAYMEAGRWEEAAMVFARALELHPQERTLAWNSAAARERDLRVLHAPALLPWPAIDGAPQPAPR